MRRARLVATACALALAVGSVAAAEPEIVAADPPVTGPVLIGAGPGGARVSAAGHAFPTRLSPNRRYLLDQHGRPYLLVGDSPHSALVDLLPGQMRTYLTNRAANGFDAVLVQVVCGPYTGNGRADFATKDGIAPFRTSGDISTPNPAYFARVRVFVRAALRRGIEVVLDPADTGQLVVDSNFLIDNGVAADRAYGRFLGRTFRSFPNVMWESGNDFQSDHWAAANRYVTAIARGIAHAAPRQLQSVELDYPVSTSFDDPPWRGLVDLNAAYTYHPTYAAVLRAYRERGPDGHDPVFLTEANYEYESLTGLPEVPEVLRRQEYWTMTSGATGQLYGNHYTWDAAGWRQERAHLDTPGVTQLRHQTRLLRSLPWWTLLPDTAHRFVTAGYGTFSRNANLLQNDYVTAAANRAGTVGLAYLPSSTTITVDLGRFARRVTARWFDPVRGTYHRIGRFRANGHRTFTSPAARRDGSDDWVLVLRAAHR